MATRRLLRGWRRSAIPTSVRNTVEIAVLSLNGNLLIFLLLLQMRRHVLICKTIAYMPFAPNAQISIETTIASGYNLFMTIRKDHPSSQVSQERTFSGPSSHLTGAIDEDAGEIPFSSFCRFCNNHTNLAAGSIEKKPEPSLKSAIEAFRRRPNKTEMAHALKHLEAHEKAKYRIAGAEFFVALILMMVSCGSFIFSFLYVMAGGSDLSGVTSPFAFFIELAMFVLMFSYSYFLSDFNNEHKSSTLFLCLTKKVRHWLLSRRFPGIDDFRPWKPSEEQTRLLNDMPLTRCYIDCVKNDGGALIAMDRRALYNLCIKDPNASVNAHMQLWCFKH